MTFSWQRMSVEEFAAYQCALGERIVKIGKMHWRRVRPFFYRPLLPFEEHLPDTVQAPLPAFFGGYQFAVPAGVEANSFLNLLMYEDTEKYSLDTLNRHKRKQVNSAAREFTIRPISDATEFKQQAYPVYLSFYERTRYGYKSERRDRDSFSRWADTLFRFPKVAILGAYRNGALGAVGISEVVEDTLVYSMVFSDNDSIRLQVTSLMLHWLRQAAANCADVKCIFTGPYKYQGRSRVDKFYFDRGCTLVKKPALIRLAPPAKTCLRYFLPDEYRRLFGCLKTEEDLAADPKANFNATASQT